MTDEPYEPKGVRFYDAASGRQLLLIADGEPHAGWLCYRHREGQWVTLREATQDDRDSVAEAARAALSRWGETL